MDLSLNSCVSNVDLTTMLNSLANIEFSFFFFPLQKDSTHFSEPSEIIIIISLD